MPSPDASPAGHPTSGTRPVILEAALAELLEVGPEKASLRSIARRVGISHQAVAHHFASRAAVLTAVAVDGFARLVDETGSAAASVPDDADIGEKAIAIGVAYVGFARDNRALFTLMLSAQVDGDDPALVEQQLATWGVLLATVREESARGWGGTLEAEYLAVMAWTIVHGIATLDHLLPAETDVATLLRKLNQAVVAP